MDSKPVIFLMHEHPTKTVVRRWSILDCMLDWGRFIRIGSKVLVVQFLRQVQIYIGDNISQNGRRILVPGVTRVEALRNHKVVTFEYKT